MMTNVEMKTLAEITNKYNEQLKQGHFSCVS